MKPADGHRKVEIHRDDDTGEYTRIIIEIEGFDEPREYDPECLSFAGRSVLDGLFSLIFSQDDLGDLSNDKPTLPAGNNPGAIRRDPEV